MKKLISIILSAAIAMSCIVPVAASSESAAVDHTMYFDISMDEYTAWKESNTSKTIIDYMTNSAVKPVSGGILGNVSAVTDFELGYEVARFSDASAWGGIIPNAKPYTSDMTTGDRFLLEYKIKSDDFGGASEFAARFNQQFLDDGGSTNTSFPVAGFYTDSNGKTYLTANNSKTTFEVATGEWQYVVIEMVPGEGSGTINIYVNNTLASSYTSSKCVLQRFTATWATNRNRFNIASGTTVDLDFYRAWKQTAAYDPAVNQDKLLESTTDYTISDSTIKFNTDITYSQFKESLGNEVSAVKAVNSNNMELLDSALMSTASLVAVRSVSMRYVKSYAIKGDSEINYFDIDFSEYKSGTASDFITSKGEGNVAVQLNGASLSSVYDAEKGYNVAKFEHGASTPWHGIVYNSRFTSGIVSGEKVVFEVSMKPLIQGENAVQFGAGGTSTSVRLVDLFNATTAYVRGGSFANSVGKWMHFVFEMTPGETQGTIVTYLDGEKIATATSSTCTLNYFNASTWSGNRISVGGAADMLIDKFRVYKTEKTYNALEDGDIPSISESVTVSENKIVCDETIKTISDLDTMLAPTNDSKVAYLDVSGNEIKSTAVSVANVNTIVVRSDSGDVIKTYGIDVHESVINADTMTSILDAHSEHFVNSISLESDGYIGVPASISVFYDKEYGEITTGAWGTPVILYVVNTAIARIGTKTDVEIIGSMLERGYIVAVLDYYGNQATVSPALDWSVQGIRTKLIDGNYFSDEAFPSGGNYIETFVVPAGYNVSLHNKYWEIDKHGVDGTLEAIVANWNTDFRFENGNHIIKWVDTEGNRKETQNDFDGNAPVWLNSDGSTNNESGEYIRVKFTKATKIEDCIKSDGTFLDLNLYMHIIYPEAPVNEVPVMCLASSHQHLASNAATADRPQLNGFTFNGYAGVIYDYGYMPMTRTDHGYTNYGGGYSGDPVGYSVHWNNNIKIDTAAMRYLRYLAASDATYKFDTDSIGVYGNSKGGWMVALGEENPQTLRPIRYYAGHHGETRYENGKTETVGLIDGGEEQPWLEYDGEKLDSGADFVYASCGGADTYISDAHAPTFISANKGDGTFYGTSNIFYNLVREHDVPSLYFEVTNGHTFATSVDMNHNVDSYKAFFDFAGYYLKSDAVQVIYTEPASGKTELATSAKITFKFSGAVPESEIVNATVTNSGGEEIEGRWEPSYGNTEWTFAPEGTYDGQMVYTITFPATLKGDNGIPMGSDYVYKFSTEKEKLSSTLSDTDVAVKNSSGSYYLTLNLPDSSEVSEFVANKYVLRFSVVNDAANIAEVYKVVSETSTSGTLLGEINLKGKGKYEIDVTEYLGENDAGDSVTFLVKPKKTAGANVIYSAPLTSSLAECSLGAYADAEFTKAPDNTSAMKATVTTNVTDDGTPAYINTEIYSNPTVVFTNSSAIGMISAEDYGRKFIVSVDVYDTVSRTVQMYSTGLSSRHTGLVDYDWPIKNFTTVKDSWTTLSIDYTVYDRDYGVTEAAKKYFYLIADSVGNTDNPMYIKNLTVTEMVTDVDIDSIDLVCTTEDDIFDKEPVSEHTFAIYNGTSRVAEYDTLTEALDEYSEGKVLKLQRNYTFTDKDVWADWGKLASVDIDLDGYKLNIASKEKSFFATVTASGDEINTQINVSNGNILLKDTALVSYSNGEKTLGGKVYDFTFENVSFVLKKNAGTTSLINKSLVDEESDAISNMTFITCTFDIDGTRLQGDKASLFAKGTEGLNFNYKLLGGNMNISNLKKLSVYERIKDVIFVRYNDRYTTLNMPNSDSVSTQYFRVEDSVAYFKATNVGETHTTYELIKDADASEYGYIPEKYLSVTDFPFVLFDEAGNCQGGYGSYSAALAALRSFSTVDGIVILLRRDYEITNSDEYSNAVFHSSSAIIPGHTIDLGGYTLTCATNTHLLHLAAKGDGAYGFDISYINGTITATDRALFGIYTGTTGKGIARAFNVTFNDITFTLADNSQLTSLFFVERNVSAGYAEVATNIAFNSCEFDITNKASDTQLTLFTLGESSGAFKFDINIIGGNLLADSSDDFVVYEKVSSNASILFSENADSKYMTITLPNGITVSDEYYPIYDGFGRYTKAEHGTTHTVYSLLRDANGTRYGIIPEEYSSKDEYPFVVFKADGTFVGGCSTWSGMLTLLGEYNTESKITALLRRDVAVAANDQYSDVVHHSSNAVIPEHFVDLDGYKICLESGANLLDITAKAEDGYGFSLVFKNGVIEATDTPLFSLTKGDGGENLSREYNLRFENVEFGFESAESLIFEYGGFDGDISQIVSNVTFDNCIFDLNSVATDAETVLFELGEVSNNLVMTVVVNGGTMKTADMRNITIYEQIGHESGIKFGKNSDKKYMSLILPSTAVVPADAYPLDYGKGIFTFVASDSVYSTYMLYNDPINTEYGVVSDEYASIEDYPFVIFKADKTFVGGYANWFDALSGLRTLKTEEGVILLLRRDFVLTGDDGYVNLIYHSTESKVYNHIVDLAGNTFTCDSGKNFMQLQIKGRDGYGINMTVRNGRINVTDSPVFGFTSSGADLSVSRRIDVRFDNVSVGLAKDSSNSSLLFGYANIPAAQGTVPSKFVFTDCTFDIQTREPAGDMTIFAVGESMNRVITDVDVVGGEICAKRSDDLKITSVTGSVSGVDFVKNSSGAYTTLSMPYTAMPLDETLNREDGKAQYTLVRTSDGISTYELNIQEETEYGTIPATYLSKEDYPFAVFMADKTFVKVYSTLSDVLFDIRNLKEDGVTVLLRRDYVQEDSPYGNITYHSTGSLVPKHTIDLGGNEFVVNSNDNFMRIEIKGVDGYGCDLTVKNGKMIVGNKPMFNILTGSYPTLSRNYSLTFENVDFALAENSTLSSLFYEYQSINSGLAETPLDLNLIDCDIDFKAVPYFDGMTVFKLGDSNDRLKMTVNVMGGTVKTASIDGFEVSGLTGNNSKYVLHKNDDGKYMTIVCPNTDVIEGVAVNTDEGDTIFTAYIKGGTVSVYGPDIDMDSAHNTLIKLTNNILSIDNVGDKSYLVLAGYDDDSRFIDYEVYEVKADASVDINDIGFDFDTPATVKAMLLDGITGIRPVCPFIPVTIQ